MKTYSFKSFFDQNENPGVQLKHNEIYLTNTHFLLKKSMLKKSHLNFIESQNKPQEDLSQINHLISRTEEENNLTEFIPTHWQQGENSYFIMIDNEFKAALNEDYYNFFKSLNCRIFVADSPINPMAIYNEQNEFIGLVMPIHPRMINNDGLISIADYEIILQVEETRRKENQGKYKRLPVVAYSGIKQKLAYKYKIIGNIEFWSLKEDKNKDNWRNALYLHNDHLFYINSFQQLENFANDPESKERYNSYFSDFQNTITEEFELSLKKAIAGECNRIHTGYAKFLDRYDEAKQAADKYNSIKDEEERIKAEEKAKKEEEQRQKELQELKEAGNKFLEGEFISGDIFLKLCDTNNVELPLRTRGWVINSLVKIKLDSYSFNGNKSTVIYKYVEQLEEVLKKVA